MHIHFIIHEDFEAPGAYEDWAKKNSHLVTYSRLYLGDSLPQKVEGIDFLIIMGGPQSPTTSKKECPHFDTETEQAFILSAINSGKAVIGVCLGAQLIGQALGASFEPSPHKEIGKFPITLTQAGLENTFFSHFGKALSVGHWHSDMPGLTTKAQIFAYSKGCPRQIIAYSDLVYGFQCHMEFTPEVIELLIPHSEKDLSRAEELSFIDTPTVLRSHSYKEMNEKLFIFLDKFSQYYTDVCNRSLTANHA